MLPLQFRFKYEEKKSPREEQFLTCMDKLFIAVHWLTVICFTSASFFTGVSETDITVWNMSLYCNEESFNQIVTPVEMYWPVVTVLVVSSAVIFLLTIEVMICGPKGRIFVNMLNYFLGLLLGWNITFILQALVSYPVPSFYQHHELKWLYCCESCVPPKLTQRLLDLDRSSRGSFPSYVICATSYVSVFLFLLCTYIDKSQQFITKLLALVLPGSISVIYGWYLWKYNVNHLHDIIGGAVLGISLAFYIAKEVFIEEKKSRFKDDFISVLMARELTLASNPENESSTEANQYTINLYSNDAAQLESRQTRRDLPPPYSLL